MTLDIFFGIGNDLSPDTLPTEHRVALDRWISRWERDEGSAFLPRQHDGHLSWYGLFNTSALRREVQALLPHWLGPAHSDSVERRGAIDHDDPFDQRLQESLPDRIVRVDVRSRDGNLARSRDTVRKRLSSMLELLDGRPARNSGPAQHVSVLLDQLDTAATSGEARIAETLLAELEHRRLLDAPNSTFAEVRVRSLLGQHDAVMASELLDRLVGLSVPHGVAIPIARSTYEIFLRDADERGDGNGLLAARNQLPDGLERILQHVPASAREHGVVVAQAVALGSHPDFAALLSDRLSLDGHLRSLLDVEATSSPLTGERSQTGAASIPTDEIVEPSSESTTDSATAGSIKYAGAAVLSDLFSDGAHQTLIDIAARRPVPLDTESHTLCVLSAHELRNPTATRIVIDLVKRDLGPPRDVQWPTRLLRTVIEDLLDSLEKEHVVSSWDAWFDTALEGKAPHPDDLHGVTDWPALEASELLERVTELVDPGVLSPVLGRLRAAHLPILDRQQRGRLATTCLTVLSLSTSRDESVQLSALDAVRDAVDAGLDNAGLSSVVNDVADIVDRQLSAGTVPWAVDLLSELVDEAALHLQAELTSLLTAVVNKLRPAFAAVPKDRWQVMAGLLDQVGASLPGDIEAQLAADPEPDPLKWVEGKSVFLYSLRERPIRQVAARLREVGASQVVTSSEKAGSTRLEGQVRGADVVLIVTSAAKHAATEAIETAASTPHIIRIHADGMSRILAAIEEHAVA